MYRGNDLGTGRLNSKIWKDENPPYMSLNMTVDQHVKIRPILDSLFGPKGNWNSSEILDHATKYLNSFIDAKKSLKIPEGLSVWVCIYIHKGGFQLDFVL